MAIGEWSGFSFSDHRRQREDVQEKDVKEGQQLSGIFQIGLSGLVRRLVAVQSYLVRPCCHVGGQVMVGRHAVDALHQAAARARKSLAQRHLKRLANHHGRAVRIFSTQGIGGAQVKAPNVVRKTKRGIDGLDLGERFQTREAVVGEWPSVVQRIIMAFPHRDVGDDSVMTERTLHQHPELFRIAYLKLAARREGGTFRRAIRTFHDMH